MSDENSWTTTGFIYERFLGDVMDHCRDDKVLCERVQMSRCHNGLHLDHIEDSNLKQRLLAAVATVAQATVDANGQNEVRGTRLNAVSEAMYLESVARLLEWVNKNAIN